MYKAIKDVGGYKIGETVPDDKAKLWLEMYDVPHVELISADDDSESKDTSESKDSSGVVVDAMLDDYLARNKNSVVSAINDDKLEPGVLDALLKLEQDGKNRSKVIRTLEDKLKEVE